MSEISWKRLLFIIPLLFLFFAWMVLLPVNKKNLVLLKNIYRIRQVSHSPDILEKRIMELGQKNRKLQNDILSLENELPAPTGLSRIYAIIGELARENRINISRIIPQDVVADTNLSHLSVFLELRASFDGTLSYIYALESCCFFFRIKEIYIDNTGGGTRLDSRIHLEISLKREDYD